MLYFLLHAGGRRKGVNEGGLNVSAFFYTRAAEGRM